MIESCSQTPESSGARQTFGAGRRLHGHEGLRRWWEDVAEAFDEIRFEPEELIDVDDERVLSVQRIVGRFRSTGIPADTPWASLIWVKDGKITRAVGYASRGRALKAAGLRR